MLSPTEKRDRYDRIEKDFLALRANGMPWESALVSLIALIKQELPSVSWVGFYRETPAGSGNLWVGPYQGPVACTLIPPGRGVCGASFEKRETLVVPDVHAFPGHIACDSLSQSEIVLPVRRAGQWIGVLDLDSHAPAAFDALDSTRLGGLLALLEDEATALGKAAEELRRGEQGMKRLVSFIHEQSGETKNRKPAELSAPRSWHEIIEKAQAILHHAANAEGKRATLTVTGSEPRLTPIAIIAVGDAFVHLIRNAVAHGIPAGGEGQVRLSVRADGRDWVIEIDDDGNGVELAALEQQAIRQGLRSPDSSLKPREAAELLFQPGFTTASGGISAGRGIGMSAVRSSIRSVGGTVDVDLPTGSGVKVILRVPSAP